MSDQLLDDAMPGGCHPALAEVAETIRPYLDGSRSAVWFRHPRSRVADWTFDDAPLLGDPAPVARLIVRRCAGPAPWAYTPFAYSWFAGTDDLGRSIGGEVVTREVDRSMLLIRGYPTYEELCERLPERSDA